jgi:hypothetical protein
VRACCLRLWPGSCLHTCCCQRCSLSLAVLYRQNALHAQQAAFICCCLAWAKPVVFDSGSSGSPVLTSRVFVCMHAGWVPSLPQQPASGVLCKRALSDWCQVSTAGAGWELPVCSICRTALLGQTAPSTCTVCWGVCQQARLADGSCGVSMPQLLEPTGCPVPCPCVLHANMTAPALLCLLRSLSALSCHLQAALPRCL